MHSGSTRQNVRCAIDIPGALSQHKVLNALSIFILLKDPMITYKQCCIIHNNLVRNVDGMVLFILFICRPLQEDTYFCELYFYAILYYT